MQRRKQKDGCSEFNLNFMRTKRVSAYYGDCPALFVSSFQRRFVGREQRFKVGGFFFQPFQEYYVFVDIYIYIYILAILMGIDAF